MVKSDFEQVFEIEKESFTRPTLIETELEKTKANYLVAYVTTGYFGSLMAQRETSPTFNFMPIDSTNLTTHINGSDGKDTVVGYLGWSDLAGQAHIVSIAVSSYLRGLRIGTLLLSTAIDMATSASMEHATLEVRSSNTIAIHLYAKLGFTMQGTRKAYYNDNEENALIMTTPSMENIDCQAFLITRHFWRT